MLHKSLQDLPTFPLPELHSTASIIHLSCFPALSDADAMNGTINSSVTATPSDFSSATHQPHVPREILAVKDAKNYKPRGKTIIICLDGTGDKVRLSPPSHSSTQLTSCQSSTMITATSFI
jgi:hypothetical protein